MKTKILRIAVVAIGLAFGLARPAAAIEHYGTLTGTSDSVELEWKRGDVAVIDVAFVSGSGTIKLYRLVTDPADKTTGNYVQFDINDDGSIDASDAFTASFGKTIHCAARKIKIELTSGSSADIDFQVVPETK